MCDFSSLWVLCAPTKSNTTDDTLTSHPATFLPGNYFHTRGESEPALPSISVAQPRPMLFITLTVKAKYEHTYEYMNNWTSGYCYSPARSLPSRQSLLFGACSSAEHGLSDRTSEVGQGGRRRCYVVDLLPRENDLCLQMPPLSVFGAARLCPLCPLSSAATMLA